MLFTTDLFMPIVHAQDTVLKYGSQFNPSKFTILNSNKEMKLPKHGKVTIYFAESINNKESSASDYLEVLQNIQNQKQILIYNLVFLSGKTKISNNLLNIIPTDTLFSKSFVAKLSYHFSQNTVLLLDHQRTIRYFGSLDLCDNFTSILKRMGFKFSYPQQITLNGALKEIKIAKRIIDDKGFNVEKMLASTKPKLLIFVRSFCTSCNEETILKSIIEAAMDKHIELYIFFRKFNQTNLVRLNNTGLMHNEIKKLYTFKDVPKSFEPIFLSRNYTLFYFSSDNKFISKKVGDRSSSLDLINFISKFSLRGE